MSLTPEDFKRRSWFLDQETGKMTNALGQTWEEFEQEEVRALAQSYLDREDEDWTFSDPEDIRRLARAVLAK